MARITKNAIRARLMDLLVGADSGFEHVEHDDEDNFEGIFTEYGAEVVGPWISAIRYTFDPADEHPEAFHPRHLEHFDTLDSAVEHLFNYHVIQ